MQLTDIGEFGFINRFARSYDKLTKPGDQGIGDDCAIISINEQENHLVTTDMLVEDIHFLKHKITASELAYKSMAVSLSDIAAMGATPLYSFLSLAIPTDTDIKYLDEFMDSYYSISQKYNVPLMGGDTTKSVDKLVISVGIIGKCKKTDTKLRSTAKEGDLICVTGCLGDSAGGLQILLNNIPYQPINKSLLQAHHMPKPEIDEGIFLSKQKSVNAMMDISDGIASDLKHILKASNKSATIFTDKVPISKNLVQASKQYHWDAKDLSISGGEDYKLLFTMQKKDFDALNTKFENKFSKPIYAIGIIEHGEGEINWRSENKNQEYKNKGFDHFGTK